MKNIIKEKTTCQYCESQLLPNGEWIGKDVQYFPRFPRSKNSSHGICPPCMEKVMKEINEMVIIK
jgi:RNA polymerase subunit RPABC4/transcription elongation factor Spt4